MATPNDNIKKLYENGLKHFSLPDFETFKADMKDEQKRKRFYDNMQQAYSLPDFNTFSTDIGAIEPPQTMQPQQAQPSSAQPQASTEIKPVKDTTAQSAQVQPTTKAVGNSVNMQPQQSGWKPTPMQQRAFEKKVEAGKTRLREMDEQFQQRMDGIQKGNRPNASVGETEFNPQTGVMETNYYTTQGNRVGTQMEQSRQNAEYNHWWEENTEEGKKSKERRLQREFDDRLAHLWQRQDKSASGNAAEKAWNAAEARHAKTTSEAARQIDSAPMLGDMESATIGRTMQKLHEGRSVAND